MQTKGPLDSCFAGGVNTDYYYFTPPGKYDPGGKGQLVVDEQEPSFLKETKFVCFFFANKSCVGGNISGKPASLRGEFPEMLLLLFISGVLLCIRAFLQFLHLRVCVFMNVGLFPRYPLYLSYYDAQMIV